MMDEFSDQKVPSHSEDWFSRNQEQNDHPTIKRTQTRGDLSHLNLSRRNRT